jgi:hypothetical protein
MYRLIVTPQFTVIGHIQQLASLYTIPARAKEK